MTGDALAKARADIAALRARVAEIEEGITRGGDMSEPNRTMNDLIRGIAGPPARAAVAEQPAGAPGVGRPDPGGPETPTAAPPAPAGPPRGSRAQGDGRDAMNDLIRRRGRPAPDPNEHVSPEMRAYLEERGIDVDRLNREVTTASRAGGPNQSEPPATGGDSAQEDN